MSNFFSILKIQFLSYFGLNKILHAPKEKKISGAGGLLFFALLLTLAIGYIGYSYSLMFGEMLVLSGRIEELFSIMIAICCLVSFFFSFYTSSNALYGYKDYEFLTALPIKTWAIVLSKLVFMYVGNVLFSLIIMIPSVYVATTFGLTLSFALCSKLLVLIIFSPFLPMVLSLFFGALISLISSRFKKKNIVQTILYVLLFGVCFGIGFLAGNKNFDITLMLSKIYFCYSVAQKAVSSWSGIFYFGLVNILPFVAYAIVVTLTYNLFNTIITAKKKSNNFKLKNYDSGTQKNTLLKREIKRLFTNATYTMNSIIGPILGFVGTIAFSIIMKNFGMGYVEDMLFIFPLILSFGYMIAPPTNCSISLEGSAFWVIKTLPVSTKEIIKAKLKVNALFNVLPAFLSGVISTIILGAPYYVVIIVGALAVLIASLAGFLGMFFNLCFPLMTWKNEVEAVKRSASVAITMVSAFIITGVCFLIGYFIPISAIFNLLIILGLIIILNVLFVCLLYKYSAKLFEKI